MEQSLTASFYNRCNPHCKYCKYVELRTKKMKESSPCEFTDSARGEMVRLGTEMGRNGAHTGHGKWDVNFSDIASDIQNNWARLIFRQVKWRHCVCALCFAQPPARFSNLSLLVIWRSKCVLQSCVNSNFAALRFDLARELAEDTSSVGDRSWMKNKEEWRRIKKNEEE